MHLSIRRKWCLHPLRSQLNRSNSHRWIRSRFQCWPLCGRATAHSCDIKAVFVTHLVKFYGTPLHVRYSVEPKGDTVRPDQWINGSIHVHMERRHVLVLNESQELVSERLCCSGWCRFVVEPFFKTVFNSFRDQCQGPSSYTTYRVGYRSIAGTELLLSVQFSFKQLGGWVWKLLVIWDYHLELLCNVLSHHVARDKC